MHSLNTETKTKIQNEIEIEICPRSKNLSEFKIDCKM